MDAIARDGNQLEITRMSFDIHPAAELFPLIDGDAFDNLVADIKANGLIDPIIITGNTILDGRNRLRACEAAGIAPRYLEVSPKDPVAYIISTNLHRRHLETFQRAAIGAELATMTGGGTGTNQHTRRAAAQNCAAAQKEDDISNEEAARIVSVSPRTIQNAKKLMRENPEAHAAAKRGDKAAYKAARAKDKPAQKSDQAQEDKEMADSSGRSYRYLKKIVNEAFTRTTGEFRDRQWIGDNIIPHLMERAEWLREFTGIGQKELSEEQALEATRITVEYINERWPEMAATADQARIEQLPDRAALQSAANEARAALSEKELPRLDRAIATAKRILEMQFEDRIKEHLGDVLKMYNEEYERYKAISDSYNGIFTQDEYKILISCLHPDRVPTERAKQYERAFHLIKNKEQLLIKKPAQSGATSMPKTVDELLSRRVKH